MRRSDPLIVACSAEDRYSLAGVVSWPGLAGVGGCVLLVALGAQIRVPLPGTDVPLTLQSLAVLLCGFFAAPRVVVSGMMTYLALGAVGVPVLTPGSAGVVGGTGGYIAGFVLGAWLVSVLRGGRNAGVGRLLLAGALGMVAIFACGLLWRVVFFGGSLTLALMTGFVPFAVKAAVQLGLAVALVKVVRGGRGTRSVDGEVADQS